MKHFSYKDEAIFLLENGHPSDISYYNFQNFIEKGKHQDDSDATPFHPAKLLVFSLPIPGHEYKNIKKVAII